MHPSLLRIGFVGTFPPDACGIATFTASLREAISGQGQNTIAGVIRLAEFDDDDVSISEEMTTWCRGDAASLERALDAAGRFDCVILQHEFGIYGGPDGDEVLDFADRCPVPIITVFHTVLPEPSAHQRTIVEALCSASAVSVVQTELARARLRQVHNIDDATVIVIPHGAELNLGGSTIALTPDDAPTILTWGLVGPGKGIEHGIRATALLSQSTRPPTYIVAGRTHPNVLAREGETYRTGLQSLAADLGIADHVVFDAQYRDFPSLRQLVRSADVILLPYDSRDQATSGVLVEAIAAGKPVVATAFPHAVEALGNGIGVVVPHGDPDAMARAIGGILGSSQRRCQLQAAAAEAAGRLAWPAVGDRYLRSIRAVTNSLAVA